MDIKYYGLQLMIKMSIFNKINDLLTADAFKDMFQTKSSECVWKVGDNPEVYASL